MYSGMFSNDSTLNSQTISSLGSSYAQPTQVTKQPGVTPVAMFSVPPTAGTVNNGDQYPGTTTGVCIDEKVLKQISENQAEFMQKRISMVQTHFGNLCTSLASYARGVGRLRDKGDKVSESTMRYANHETLNPTSTVALTEFTHYFSSVQDYAESQMRRIEEKAVKPLTSYGIYCKQAHERIRKAYAARRRELDQKMTLERTRKRTRGNMQNSQTELQKASINALKADNEVEQEIETFERKKLEDLKQVMSDFLNIEILYHIKALEKLSECSKYVSAMDVEMDLEQFRYMLRPISTQTKGNVQANMAGLTAQMQAASLQQSTSALQQGQKSKQKGNEKAGRQIDKKQNLKTTATTATDDSDDDEDDDVTDDDDDDVTDDDDDSNISDVDAKQKTSSAKKPTKPTPKSSATSKKQPVRNDRVSDDGLSDDEDDDVDDDDDADDVTDDDEEISQIATDRSQMKNRGKNKAPSRPFISG